MTVADVDRLLQEFIAADRTGGDADPLRFLARVDGPARTELEALIDGYLARAPRRTFDRAAFERSPASAVAQELGRALGGASGSWPALLPRLRHRARLRRAEVVRQLTQELGVGDEAKVGRYYHGMEQGTLPAAGVSDRVLEALGRIVGVTAERLRETGLAEPGRAPGQAAAAFARVGSPDPDLVPADALMSGEAATESGPPDAIDDLFTGAAGPAAGPRPSGHGTGS